MSFYPELDTLKLNDLVTRFREKPLDGQEYSVAYYSEVASRIKQNGGDEFLEAELKRVADDEARLRAVISALTLKPILPTAGLQMHLLSYLQDKREFIVMEAIDGLWAINAKEVVDQVLTLRVHVSPYVRGAVLRYVRRLHPDRALSMLIEVTKDSHPIVRAVAADELGELGNSEALACVELLLVDENENVRQAAKTALESLRPLSNS